MKENMRKWNNEGMMEQDMEKKGERESEEGKGRLRG